MNSASTDLDRHLGILKERMRHPTDYEKAMEYFLEEFAGDKKFVEGCIEAEAAGLGQVVRIVTEKALGSTAGLGEARIYHASGQGFYHGSSIAGQRVVLFLYFDDIDMGIAAFIPGVSGGMEIARFQMKGAQADPSKN